MQDNIEIEFKNNKFSTFILKNINQSPEEYIDVLLQLISNKYTDVSEFIAIVYYSLNEHWHQKTQKLVAHYYFKRNSQNNDFGFQFISVVSEEYFNIHFSLNQFENFNTNNELFQKSTITVNFDKNIFEYTKKQILENPNSVTFNPNEVFLLEPIFIPKPWGQEIWFTGVEKRGVSKIKSIRNENTSIPIPWFFSSLPKKLLGKKFAEQNLMLVKILDPFPEPIFGDLYYELHTEKNEVYIVTEITATEGKIKFGANSKKLEEINYDIHLYKQQLFKVIKDYEKIRRKIDFLFDEFRIQFNIPLNEPISTNTIKEWLLKIPTELVEEEKSLRLIMDSYSGYLNLIIGDVIKVPTLIPHALQHGVKVIEFQTPTYERMILSFAQKVLTQNHWDTEKAIEVMNITPPNKTKLELIQKTESYCEELVCSFKEFQSSRFKLEENAILYFQALDNYRILFNVFGSVYIKTNKIEYIEIPPSSCIFIPANLEFELKSLSGATILFCLPN